MKFCFETILEAPKQDVFAFFADPRNLQLLHAGDRGFHVLHHDGNIHVGSATWFQVNVLGILPIAMGFRHILYEPPDQFTEMLIHGPFSRFIHVHEFIDTDSGTLVRDRLDIELPYFYGGEFSMRHGVAPAIHQTFDARAKTLEGLQLSGTIAAYAGQSQGEKQA